MSNPERILAPQTVGRIKSRIVRAPTPGYVLEFLEYLDDLRTIALERLYVLEREARK